MSKKTKRAAELAAASGPALTERVPFWVAAISLAVLILFWQATSFIYLVPGEGSQIIANPAIVERQNVAAAFSEKVAWQPLAWMSHMLDFAMFGPKPGPQRFVNLLLHAVNCVLVFLVFRRMTGRTSRSGILALLLAVHPLRVEPVIWLIERRTLLATLFTLLALWAHAGRDEAKWKRAAIFIACVLAALSHPVGAVAPVLLLLADVWPLRRETPLGARIAEKAELALPALATIFLSARGSATAEALWTNGIYDAGTRAWHGLLGMGIALGKTLLPFSLDALNSMEPPVYAAAGLVLLAGAAFAMRKSAVTAGALWFVTASLPAIGILHPEISPWRDSGFYLAQIGLLAAIVWIAAEWDTDKALGLALVGGLIWAGLAWGRIGEWRTSESLLRTSVERGGHPLAHYQLGQILLGGQRPAEAEKEFRAVTAQRPQAVDPYLLLGTAYQLQRRNDDAAQAYRKAIQNAPGRADGYFGLGLMQTTQGQPKEGMENLTLAIERGLAPAQEAQARNAVGVYLMNQKRYKEAEPHLERSWQLVPTYASAHRNYALTLDSLGQSGKAFHHLEKKARLYTNDSDEVVEVWGMLYNKLTERERKKIDEEQKERQLKKKK